MIMIKYEEYVNHVTKRLGGLYYPNYVYEWKFEFVKIHLHNESALRRLFKRYMQDDIYIKWDIKNEND